MRSRANSRWPMIDCPWTQYIDRPSGDKLGAFRAGALISASLPLPGGMSAVYNNNGLKSIRHMDDLGSSRLATTWAHGIYSKESYAPFGEAYNEAGTTDRVFTGQTQDTASGVYDYLFRKYDPTAGRWMSPDPAGWGAVDPAFPQSLDRYAYANNDPLIETDPVGLSCVVSADGSSITDNGDGYGCMYNGRYITSTGPVYSYLDSMMAFSQYPQNVPTLVYVVNSMSSGEGLSVPAPIKCAFNGKVLSSLYQATSDAIGAVPGEGNLYKGVQFSLGVASGVISSFDGARGAALGGAGIGLSMAEKSLQLSLTTMSGEVKAEGTKAIPVLGNAVSVLSAGTDLLGSEGFRGIYQACLNSTN